MARRVLKCLGWLFIAFLLAAIFIREGIGLWGDVDFAVREFNRLGGFGKMMELILQPPPGAFLVSLLFLGFLFCSLNWERLSPLFPPVQKNSNRAQQQINTTIRGDTPIWRAIHYVSLATGEGHDRNCWPNARLAIRNAALNEQIKIHGRKRLPNEGVASDVLTKICKDYWKDFEITAMSTSPEYIESDHTRIEGVHRDRGNEYFSLLVDIEEICRIWPIMDDRTITAGEAIEAIEWASLKSAEITEINLRGLAHIKKIRVWGRPISKQAIPIDMETLAIIPAETWEFIGIDLHSTLGPLATNRLRYLHNNTNDSVSLFEAVRFNRLEIAELCLTENTKA